MEDIQAIFQEIDELIKLRREAYNQDDTSEEVRLNNEVNIKIEKLKKIIAQLNMLIKLNNDEIKQILEDIQKDFNGYDTANYEEKQRICNDINQKVNNNQWLTSLDMVNELLSKCQRQ